MDFELDARTRALHEWFVTSQSATSVGIGSRASISPASVLHAKRMGTTLTACGELAYTWPKLWDRPFGEGHGEWCSACVHAVLGPGHAAAWPARFPVQPR